MGKAIIKNQSNLLVPPQGLDIKWGLPISNKLALCCLFNEGAGTTLINLANRQYNGKMLTSVRTTYNKLGRCLYNPQVGTTNIMAMPPAFSNLFFFNAPFTIFIRASIILGGTSNYPILHKHVNSGDSGYVSINNMSGSYYFSAYSGGTTYTGTNRLYLTKNSFYAWVYDGAGILECYKDGNLHDTIAITFGTNTGIVKLCAIYAQPSGYFSLLYAWQRRLLYSEILQLYQSPYTFIKSGRRNKYLFNEVRSDRTEDINVLADKISLRVSSFSSLISSQKNTNIRATRANASLEVGSVTVTTESTGTTEVSATTVSAGVSVGTVTFSSQKSSYQTETKISASIVIGTATFSNEKNTYVSAQTITSKLVVGTASVTTTGETNVVVSAQKTSSTLILISPTFSNSKEAYVQVNRIAQYFTVIQPTIYTDKRTSVTTTRPFGKFTVLDATVSTADIVSSGISDVWLNKSRVDKIINNPSRVSKVFQDSSEIEKNLYLKSEI